MNETLEMPKIVKTLSWGMTWFKNITEDGGAMKEAINTLKQDELVVHSQSKKNGRLWGCLSSDKLVNIITKNHGI